jgi:hypothetical protein
MSANDASSFATLSEIRPDRTRGLDAFIDSCSWTAWPADFAPDMWLLVLIDERPRWLEAERLGYGSEIEWRDNSHAPALPAVGELPPDWLPPLLEDVQVRYPGWRLTGDEHQPASDRLDAHFARLQEAKQLEVAARHAQEAEDARRRAEVDREARERAIDADRALWGRTE